MKSKLKSLTYRLFVPMISVIFFFSIYSGSQAAEQQIAVSTSNVGGSWYLIGGAMVPLFAKYAPEIKITTMPGSGGENLRFVSMRRSDMGFTTASSGYYGYQQEGLFEKLKTGKDVRGMFGAHGMFIYIVVREDSEIKDISDLRGKRIAMGPTGSGTNPDTQRILKAYGMEVKKDYQPQWISHSDGSRAVRDRLTDCQFFLSGVPAADITNLCTSTKVRFLEIDEEHQRIIEKAYPFLYKETLPANTHPGQTKPVQGIGENTVFIVHKEVPDEVVYKMMKVIYEHNDELAVVHKGALQFTHENAKRGVTMPFHPGAVKYYKEIGVTK